MRAVVSIALIVAAVAAAAAESARDILDHQQALDRGPRRWDDRYERMRLTVTDEHRGARHLEIETFDRKEDGQTQKSRVIFSAPADKAGFDLLGVTHRGKAADQWVYTPENRRVRKVAPNRRAEPFDITDFTYHDLDVLADLPNWTEQDASSALRGTDVIDGVSCWVIELTPQLEHVAYGRILLWIGQENLVARQVEFYEKVESPGMVGRVVAFFFGGGDARPTTEPLRRFRQRDIRNVGAIPVAYKIEVETPGKQSKTTIDVVDVRFNQGLSETLFTQASLGTR